MAKEIFCCIGVDVDAVAGWLGSYGGEDSPDDISRGIFAGEVGSRRLLKLFDKYGLKTTWFIPGHSIETFPEETKLIVDAGHEIGMHGYSHENPISMTPEQEEAVLIKCIGLIESVCGRRPTGYVAPSSEIWRDQFDYIYREEDYAVFGMTIHPDVSGRPQVLLMLERMIEHINGHDGVRWAKFDEIADDFAKRSPRKAASD